LTQSGGGEYSLGTATLTMRGDMQPLERDLARMRAVIADMEKRGANIPLGPKPPPPPPPETQRGYEGLVKTMETLRRGMQGDGEAFTMLSEQLRASGQAAAAAGGDGGFGGAAGGLSGLLGMAGKAVPMLGQLGLAAMGIQAIFGGMKGAISAVLGPLEQLSAEAGRLNKQVAEAGIFTAQSFAILGPDGKLVEGTARQMQMVRGAILKEFKGIQKEVANINGATASEIYEGFNIILTNISSLGEKGTTENAAKLATRLAAGMNTLGVPGFQLRSEVNALMMGNIDRNAMMATKLGITGEDVRQQQAQGTYYDFLMKKLEKLYEGQKVLALSLANVKSNFDDVNQAIAAESGQPLERDTAQMMQTILVTFKNLQGSFSGLFKSIAEAVGPIIKLLGPVVSAFTSIGAIASSVGRVIMDVFGLVTAALANDVLPLFTALARSLELVARTVQLVAEGIGALINPLKAMLNVESDGDAAGVTSFFDQIFQGFDKASEAIEGFNQKWSKMVLNTSLSNLRGRMKMQGKSEEEIAAAENDMRERFKLQTGLTEEVQLRSLKLPPNITNYLDELNTRLGSGATRALNISKAWADIKQKGYQNEIKSLEQGLTLMNKQREVAEAMSSVAAARRALAARSFELGVQVAASPEAKAAAEARLADVKLRQEKETIAERRGILQTEREIQQRQMLIQEKQIKIQQEQLKIQLAEARADQVRVTEATQAVLKARGNTSPRSQEWQGFTRELNVLNAERARNDARVAGAQTALRLAFEAEGQLGTINGLESQRLNLQGQQLDIQGQSAQYTREQQALLAQISQAELRITNELTRATNEQNRKKQALENQTEQINQQIKLQEQQSRLEKAQADLALTRAKAEVEQARRLEEVQQLQERARNGGGTASVIEAQIAAAAAGVSGMESAADVQKRLYDAREQQMQREHQLQNRQMEVQQMRERSEVRIQELQLRGQQVAIGLQRAQILADIARLGLGQQQDRLSQMVAGASRVPSLPLPVSSRTATDATQSLLQAANSKLGIFAGQTERCADAIRELFKVAGIAIGTTKRAWDGLASGPRLASSFFGQDIGQRVNRQQDLRPGDLVGFERTYGNWGPGVQTHVGLYAGDGMMYDHSSRRGLVKRPMSTFEGKFMYGVRPDALSIGATTSDVATNTANKLLTAAGPTGAAPSVPVTSTANQVQGLQQGLQGLSTQESRLSKVLEDLLQWLNKMGDAQAVERENLSEQQQAERAQFEFEQRKAMLTAQVMNTSEGRLGVAAGDALSGGISSSLSGALQALLSGGDVRQAVSGALAQVGQTLMQATLDALLNPLLSQLQGQIFKAISGVDINAMALQGAAGTLNQAGGTLFAAGNALLSAAGVQGAAAGAGAVGNAGSMWASLAAKLPSLIGGLGGFTGGLDLAGAFSGTSSLIDFTAAPSLVSGLGSFTPGLAGGNEVQYGLDYLVGEKNAEIVRFNKTGGRVYSNRALTKALGVPFQRTPGGGAAVADGGGDFLGVPFMGAGSTRAASGSRSTPGIPFLKASSGGGGGGAAAGAAGGAPGAGMARSSSLRLSLETQVINGVEYATVQQVREAAEAAAQAGRDSAYDGMRNNPSIQASLGLR